MKLDTAEREPLDDGPESRDSPNVSVHESTPERSVFIEAANTDGWIASDTTIEVTR
jgi:myo-inositol-hexaphosphate 3-phosphohydrolase